MSRQSRRTARGGEKVQAMLTEPRRDDRQSRWTWTDAEPYYRELAGFDLRDDTLDEFLRGWAGARARILELAARLEIATTQNTADLEAKQQYEEFLTEVFPSWEQAEQRLRVKLLDSGFEPPSLRVALRGMRADVALFREENLPLLAREEEMATVYFQITGAQMVSWDGREVTLDQLEPVYEEQDRARRERAWRLDMERRLRDRQAIGTLWKDYVDLRVRQAANAGFADYRLFRWQQLKRFDYTPADCMAFHEAIEQVVVPVASRLYEQRRQRLGVDTLRPWDLNVDPHGRPPLKPGASVGDLTTTAERMFRGVEPAFGEYFATLWREGFLDLEARPNKAPGGYCTSFPVAERPFIFMRAVGTHDDVQTLLHEGGHAFHDFETYRLPYASLIGSPGMEFAEVGSMGMELLAGPFLSAANGGFYSESDAARARIDTLQRIIYFWPYMAVVDAFQMWVYEHPDAAREIDACDEEWGALWSRFMPGVDWSGLEEARRNGWQQKLHIHTAPLYYVEYGLAQLGAVQVWANARQDFASAVAAYRGALALGNTVSLADLFAAAGARFAFDRETVRSAVNILLETIDSLGGA
jgi:oligoendopeptidase F